VTAGIKTYLFDLNKAIVIGSLAALKQLKPAPLALATDADCIIPADYDHDLAKLRECNLVIEAISERLEYKLYLYKKIAPYLRGDALFTTNTAGLSIEMLSSALAADLQRRFCGLHFFNPPRYMKLVEIIPNRHTDPALLLQLENFLITCLGKGVVYAKDTPGFIGNRVGLFSILSCLHHAKHFNLAPNIVDALMGKKSGRSRSAIFRTMDIVGLDTFRQAVMGLHKALEGDPWQSYFVLPNWITQLIDKGALGQKTRMGIYKKENEQILVYQLQEQEYRPAIYKIDSQLTQILSIPDPQQKMIALRSSVLPQAQFLWACFRDLFHYIAYHFNSIARHPRDIDLALRWGYGWQEGPFEIWQKANWAYVAHAIESDIAAGKSMSTVPLPSWVHARAQGVYTSAKVSPDKTQRQLFPEAVLGEEYDEGQTIFETHAVRLWCHPDDNIPILSFKTKKNAWMEGVIEGLLEALERAESDYNALIIWQRHGEDFGLGVHLKTIRDLIAQFRYDIAESTIKRFQALCMRIKYSAIPVIVALNGRVLSGACELSLHARSRIASIETYMGFIEMGVGLIPAGGGCKELILNGTQYVEKYFDQIMMRVLSRSALDAKARHYLRAEDKVVMNNKELLYFAKKQAHYLADVSYYPPLMRSFPVLGRTGLDRFQDKLTQLYTNNAITHHDYFMGKHLAKVLCGGKVPENSFVTEQSILDLECEAFMTLIKTECTQARIKYKLEKGQYLRN